MLTTTGSSSRFRAGKKQLAVWQKRRAAWSAPGPGEPPRPQQQRVLPPSPERGAGPTNHPHGRRTGLQRFGPCPSQQQSSQQRPPQPQTPTSQPSHTPPGACPAAPPALTLAPPPPTPPTEAGPGPAAPGQLRRPPGRGPAAPLPGSPRLVPPLSTLRSETRTAAAVPPARPPSRRLRLARLGSGSRLGASRCCRAGSGRAGPVRRERGAARGGRAEHRKGLVVHPGRAGSDAARGGSSPRPGAPRSLGPWGCAAPFMVRRRGGGGRLWAGGERGRGGL